MKLETSPATYLRPRELLSPCFLAFRPCFFGLRSFCTKHLPARMTLGRSSRHTIVCRFWNPWLSFLPRLLVVLNWHTLFSTLQQLLYRKNNHHRIHTTGLALPYQGNNSISSNKSWTNTTCRMRRQEHNKYLHHTVRTQGWRVCLESRASCRR